MPDSARSRKFEGFLLLLRSIMKTQDSFFWWIISTLVALGETMLKGNLTFLSMHPFLNHLLCGLCRRGWGSGEGKFRKFSGHLQFHHWYENGHGSWYFQALSLWEHMCYNAASQYTDFIAFGPCPKSPLSSTYCQQEGVWGTGRGGTWKHLGPERNTHQKNKIPERCIAEGALRPILFSVNPHSLTIN